MLRRSDKSIATLALSDNTWAWAVWEGQNVLGGRVNVLFSIADHRIPPGSATDSGSRLNDEASHM